MPNGESSDTQRHPSVHLHISRRWLFGAAAALSAAGATFYMYRRQARKSKGGAHHFIVPSEADGAGGQLPLSSGPSLSGGAAASAPQAGSQQGDQPPQEVPVMVQGVSSMHVSSRVRTGKNQRWCWSDNETDVVVEAFAGGVDSARDISVTFQPMHLAVSVRGDSIISGPLCEPIHPDECSWQFDGTGKDRRVVLTLTKARASISPWQSLIK